MVRRQASSILHLIVYCGDDNLRRHFVYIAPHILPQFGVVAIVISIDIDIVIFDYLSWRTACARVTGVAAVTRT